VNREWLANFKTNIRPCSAKKLLPIAPSFAYATAGKDCRLVRRNIGEGELPIADLKTNE
jgi:hypothetical protein